MITFMPLKQVCSRIVDCSHESPQWLREGIPVIRNFNLINGQLNTDDLYYVDRETYRNRTKRAIPEAGDIIFSREAPIGNCAIVPEQLQCCLGQRLVLLKVNREICNSKYLLAALLSDYVKKQIDQVSKTGSTVSNFAIGDLKNLMIPIADNLEDVSSFFATVNGKISGNNEISSILKKTLTLIYNYWFVQFDFPNEDGKPYKTSGGNMVWNKDLKREIPEGWAVDTIGTIITEREKSTVQVGETAGHEGNIPFFTSGDAIIMYDTSFAKGKNCYLNTGGNADVKYYIGDAAYSTDTWCVTADIYSSYLYLYLDSIIKYLNVSFFAGSGLKHLQKDAFKKHKIVIPPKELVHEFNKTADKCFAKASALKVENQELSSLRDFLLPLLMNGQVTIKNAIPTEARTTPDSLTYGMQLVLAALQQSDGYLPLNTLADMFAILGSSKEMQKMLPESDEKTAWSKNLPNLAINDTLLVQTIDQLIEWGLLGLRTVNGVRELLLIGDWPIDKVEDPWIEVDAMLAKQAIQNWDERLRVKNPLVLRFREILESKQYIAA